jgi:hypothetical protein
MVKIVFDLNPPEKIYHEKLNKNYEFQVSPIGGKT